MNVAELIKHLEGIPKDAEVVISTYKTVDDYMADEVSWERPRGSYIKEDSRLYLYTDETIERIYHDQTP